MSERDGQLTEEALRCKPEIRGHAVTCYVYPPGTYFSSHVHDADKIDAVLSGTFRITHGTERHIRKAGDLLMVPRGAIHDAIAEGDDGVCLDAVRTR